MVRSPGRRVVRRFAPAVALVVAAATSGGAASASAPTPAGGGATAFSAALAQLPAAMLSADGAALYYTDRALAWERLGVGPNTEERASAVGRTFEVGTYSQAPTMFAPDVDLERSREEIGFTTFDIDREASVLAPPQRVVVAVTTVTPDAVRAALTTDPVWSAELTEVDDAGGTFYSWAGDDSEVHIDRRSPLRPLGQAGHIAVGGTERATVVQTLAADDMQAALAAGAGREPSVLDSGPFAAAATALDDEGATVLQAIGLPGATLFMPPFDASAEVIEQLMAALPQLVPYASILVVEVIDPDGNPRTEIEVTHYDEASATTNATAMAAWLANGVDSVSNRPLAELLPGATVTAEGPVVRVTVDGPGHYSTATNMLMSRALFPV